MTRNNAEIYRTPPTVEDCRRKLQEIDERCAELGTRDRDLLKQLQESRQYFEKHLPKALLREGYPKHKEDVCLLSQ
jgi:hypothetical protein